MSEAIRILYVDDYPLDRELVRDSLEKEHGGFRLTEAASRADLDARLAEGDFDLVLSDFNILGFEGLQVIETVHAKDPRIPVVIVTGTGSEEIAVEALKRGAADYVIKTPKHIRRLPRTIHAALERKKLEEERTHAEQERDRLFNYSIDLLCIAGFDGYFKQLNPAWERTLGWTNEELMSKPYVEFVHPEDRQATTQAAGNLVDGKLVFSFENRYQRKDGAYKWLAWNSYPLAEENLIFAVAHDVTNRKQSEEMLRESEQRFRNLANNSPDTIYVLDLVNQRPIFFNREEFCGYSRSELESSNSILSAVHPDDHHAVSVHWQAVLQGENDKAHVIEYRLRRKDGAWEWIQSRETLLARDGSGEPTQLLVTLTLITERKRTEESLQQAEQKYRNIFEHAREAIHQTTLDGKYITVNPATAVMLGFDSPEELISSANDLNTQFYVEAGRREEFRRLMETHETISDFESEVYRKDGSRIWVSENIHTVRDHDGTLLFYEGTSLDITGRKQAEERIQQQVEHLTALNLIDQAISASFELRITLGILLEQVTTQLRVDAASVLLHNQTMHTLEFKAGKGFRGTGMTKLNLRLGESYAGKASLERRLITVPHIAKADPPFAKIDRITGEGFVAYYAVPLIAKGQVKGVLEIFHRARLTPDEEWLNFLQTLAGQTAIAIDNAELFNNLHRSNTELMQAYDATIEGWSRALDLRDKETEGHTQRVTEMALRLAEAMGQKDEELMHMRRGGLLHDIGKLGVPDGILLKPDKLTDDEWVVMKKHPQFAFDMLAPIAYLRHALDIPYCHHEKWDGSGYPRGLKGEGIPLAARIFAVVDVWDALRSDRPYRKGWGEDKVRQHIRQQSGIHFDPQMVDVFLKLGV